MSLPELNGKANSASSYDSRKDDSQALQVSNGDNRTEKVARKNQDNIQRLTERMFHVDHALHSMQDILLELGNKVKAQGEQLERIDVLQLQIETNEMKLSAVKEDSETLASMDEQIRDMDARVKAFEALHGKVDTLHRQVNENDSSRQVPEPLHTESLMRLEDDIRDLQTWRKDVGDFHSDRAEEDPGHLKQEHFDDHVEKTQQSLQEHHSQFDEIRERLEMIEGATGGGKTDSKDGRDIDTIGDFAENNDYHDSAYTLSPSMWDVALLLWSPAFRNMDSFIGSVLYLVNCVMQGTFLIICGFFFVNPDIDENTVAGARMFRTFDAHHDNWLNWGTSLAQRLCLDEYKAPDPIAMVIGGFQNAELQEFETYLKKDAKGEFERFFNGEIMCLLAMACWVASVMEEVNDCLDLGLTLINYPIGSKTLITLSDDALNLESLSHARKFAGLLFLGIRFGVVCALTMFGCVWLGGTDGITDLLLNAVALGFILTIDEMLYAALFPDRGKTSLERFAPLKRKHWPSLGGFQLKNAFACLIGPACLIVSFNRFTRPLATHMMEVFDEMCKGDLNFTYAHDTLSRVILARIDTETGAAFTRNLTDLSVTDKINGHIRGPDDWTLYVDPSLFGTAVASIKSIPMIELIGLLNPSCTDVLNPDDADTVYLQLQALLQRQLHMWAYNCSDVEKYCTNKAFHGIVVRSVCAKTCMCDSPYSIVPSHVAVFGCPDSCMAAKRYQNELHRGPCNDTSLWELHSKRYWKSWATYIEDPLNPNAIPGIGDAMLSYGCSFHAHVTSPYYSSEELRRLSCRGALPGRMRPIAVACPTTCHCHLNLQVLKSDGICAYGSSYCLPESRRR